MAFLLHSSQAEKEYGGQKQQYPLVLISSNVCSSTTQIQNGLSFNLSRSLIFSDLDIEDDIDYYELTFVSL